MIISERIFELLKERNMTQKVFSDKTGITPSTISDWKRKKTNPSSDKIMLICDVLEVTPYQLLSGVENEKYNQLDYMIIDKKSKEFDFINAYNKLDEESKLRLQGYMTALGEK